jgi:polygalacturonase
VLLPAGTYLCGSIHLKSNIDLHLSAGCTILAAPAKMNAYDASEPFDFPEYQDGGHTYFRYERPDYRPAVLLDDVKNDVIRHLDAPTEEGVEQVIRK